MIRNFSLTDSVSDFMRSSRFAGFTLTTIVDGLHSELHNLSFTQVHYRELGVVYREAVNRGPVTTLLLLLNNVT